MNADEVFEAWWESVGRKIFPEGDSLIRKTNCKRVAEVSFKAALHQSGNYVADHETYPQVITFANGRVVAMKGQGHLFVSCVP